jgi:hypothetical protein
MKSTALRAFANPKAISFLFLLAASLGATPGTRAQGYNHRWSSVGSAGVTQATRNFFGCVLPNASLNGAARGSPAKEQVPIKGSFETTFRFIPIEFVDGVPVKFSAPVQGTGRVSHLGRSAVFIEQVVDFTTVIPTLASTTIFIAANGDELHAMSAGIASDPDAEGNTPFSGILTFIGGTGRFSDAEGSAEFTGEANLQTLTGHFSFDGTIRY